MNWKRFIPFLRQKGVPGKPLLDHDYIESSIENSPVPIVLIIVLIWMVSAVLLLLSENRQRDLTVWSAGQQAPFSVWARTDFNYADSGETEKKRQDAQNAEPGIYRIDQNLLNGMKLEFSRYFSALQNKQSAAANRREFIPDDNEGSALANSAVYSDAILNACKNNQDEFDRQLNIMLRHGIAGAKLLIPAEQKVCIISPDGKEYLLDPPDNRIAAERLAAVLKLAGQPRKEFVDTAAKLLNTGDLSYDVKASAEAKEAAAARIKPVIKEKKRGDLLIERRQTITRETVDMLHAERIATPRGYGIILLGNLLALSFLLLLTALFFLYRTYPKIFNTPRRFSTAGIALILALIANFLSLQLFLYFFRHGIMPDYELLFFIVPIPFGAALLSLLLGNRTALFAGFLIAAISALMILPDRSFELLLRWYAIGALTSLLVRNVTNYRSFFVRTFLCGGGLTAIVNSDIIYSICRDPELLKIAVIAISANAFICATAALLMIFAFELVFNVDTSISLMLLSDFNHPLLEKLKREAPGTMFHSMTVATLAEDAAKAIKANPARAKAGALFHDIGKLAMPQYFVENNVDSPKIHLNMPPQRSCGIIRGHVKEGLALAREYRLCSFLRDAIATHHGDDLISFFYRRAMEESNGELPVLEAQFRYDGEPPVDKELTIISLADACEAASRSLNKPTPAKLEALVNDIFIGRIRGGQLRNSELTAAELDIVRECFIADLISFNHGRIAYQKENQDDTTALPVAEPPDAGTEKK